MKQTNVKPVRGKLGILIVGVILGSSATQAFGQTNVSESGVRLYTLEQIFDSARQNNIAIRSARHDIEVASQQRREAFTKFFPNVSATRLWFNANKGTAEKTLNPSSPEDRLSTATSWHVSARRPPTCSCN